MARRKAQEAPPTESPDEPIVVTDADGVAHQWVDDGSEVPNPDQSADAGALIHRDNCTTPGSANG